MLTDSEREALSTLVLEAALAAGRAIEGIYALPFTSSSKQDGSPVTEADHRAEAVILDMLSQTGIPVLAEESVAAGRIPALGERYFVVDPLDGTKEFIKRNGEFTVNIALVEGGRPVLGVVVAPAIGAGFLGSSSRAQRFSIAGNNARDWREIRVSRDGPVRVVASRSHGHAALEQVCAALNVIEDVSVGSSLKFCLLAEGRAQLYPRFTPTAEWDTAAGHAVLEAAGGVVLTLEGHPLRYGKAADAFLNPFFVAATSPDQARAAAAAMRKALAHPPQANPAHSEF